MEVLKKIIVLLLLSVFFGIILTVVDNIIGISVRFEGVNAMVEICHKFFYILAGFILVLSQKLIGVTNKRLEATVKQKASFFLLFSL